MIEVKFTGTIILTGTIEDFMDAYIKTTDMPDFIAESENKEYHISSITCIDDKE